MNIDFGNDDVEKILEIITDKSFYYSNCTNYIYNSSYSYCSGGKITLPVVKQFKSKKDKIYNKTVYENKDCEQCKGTGKIPNRARLGYLKSLKELMDNLPENV